MKLKLVSLEPKYRDNLFTMMEQWLAAEPKKAVTPYSIVREDYRDFENYLAKLDIREPREGLVPDSTFFCLDEERNAFVGAVNIRHCLNAHLLKYGGHIGDGVCPGFRGQGIGTAMVALALEKCRQLGLERVLMTCDKENIASARTIQKNGGVLENEVVQEGEILQRYWIDLKQCHYDFFQNRLCEYFPCHENADPETFSCLFCYCPLYCLGDKCGGKFTYTADGIKDCSGCLRPHRRECYDGICRQMSQVIALTKKR